MSLNPSKDLASNVNKIFADDIDSNCEDLIQVEDNSKCNFCGIGYYLNESGECSSNPTSSCWIEGLKSYFEFNNSFTTDETKIFFKEINEDLNHSNLTKKVQLLSTQNDNNLSNNHNLRKLSEDKKIGDFCYVCKPGYYQLPNGSCIKRS